MSRICVSRVRSDSSRRTSICLPSTAREIDEDGEYATLRGVVTTHEELMHFNRISKRLSIANCDTADDTSEEGKLLDCVRDDSVTYASTRDIEPPMPPPPPPLDSNDDDEDDDDCEAYAVSSTETLVNPVTVTVHTNDTHVNIHPNCISYASAICECLISNSKFHNIYFLFTAHCTTKYTIVESNLSCRFGYGT